MIFAALLFQAAVAAPQAATSGRPPSAPAHQLSPFAAQAKAAPACAATDTDLPPLYANWVYPSRERFRIGRAFPVDVRVPDDVAYYMEVRPLKPGRAALIPLMIRRAGIYRIALSDEGWIDLVANAKTVGSVAHGAGPVCSTIHKTVDFKLRPGMHWIELSGILAPRMRAMVVPVS